jgi:hypothetical protein
MILKFKTGQMWVLYGEIDHLTYEPFNERGAGIPGDVLLYEASDEQQECPALRPYRLTFFTKNMNEATVIHAYAPIYLMNDQGRTVETI